MFTDLRGNCMVAALGAVLAGSASAQPVAAPPLPPGSDRVVVEPGMNKPERDRQIRAHLHRHHVRRDPFTDSTTTTGPAVQPTAPTTPPVPVTPSVPTTGR
jgi:hypothetical protein